VAVSSLWLEKLGKSLWLGEVIGLMVTLHCAWRLSLRRRGPARELETALANSKGCPEKSHLHAQPDKLSSSARSTCRIDTACRRGARLRRRARVAPACSVGLGGGRLIGAVGSVGPAGVTLQFAIARVARGSRAQPRPPPKAGPAAPWCGFGDRRVAHGAAFFARQGSLSARRTARTAAGRSRVTSSAWSRTMR